MRGVPLAGEALGFGHLPRRHALSDDGPMFDRHLTLITGPIRDVSDGGPQIGLHVVLRNTEAFGEPDSELELRIGVPLLSRQSEPAHRFRIVLRYTDAVPV